MRYAFKYLLIVLWIFVLSISNISSVEKVCSRHQLQVGLLCAGNNNSSAVKPKLPSSMLKKVGPRCLKELKRRPSVEERIYYVMTQTGLGQNAKAWANEVAGHRDMPVEELEILFKKILKRRRAKNNGESIMDDEELKGIIFRVAPEIAEMCGLTTEQLLGDIPDMPGVRVPAGLFQRIAKRCAEDFYKFKTPQERMTYVMQQTGMPRREDVWVKELAGHLGQRYTKALEIIFGLRTPKVRGKNPRLQQLKTEQIFMNILPKFAVLCNLPVEIFFTPDMPKTRTRASKAFLGAV